MCEYPLTRNEERSYAYSSRVGWILHNISYGAFILDVNSMFNENLGRILGGTHC
jgi:hypothetical protein